jgi:hypothetical protein
MGVALRAAADPAPPAWDGAAAAHARLEDEAVTAVALLERFGDLLAVALDAAGRGAEDALDAAVAERAWVVSELRPLLAALREAKRSGAHVPAEAARLAQVLAPVDVALRQAGLLHERLTDDVDRWAPIALVR